MVWSISDALVAQPDAYTLTEEYRIYIESLLTMFRNDSGTTPVDLSPEQGYLYRFDLTSFLLDNNVPMEDHELVMRINGKTSVHDIDETLTRLLIPDQNLVAQLKQIFRTKLAS